MLVPCPQCGLPLASIIARDGAPAACPRCSRTGGSEGAAVPATADEATPASEAGVALDTPAVRADGPGPTERAGDDHAGQPDPLSAMIAGANAAEPAGSTAAPPPPARVPRRARAGTPSFVRASAEVVPLGPRWPGMVVIGALLLVLALQLLLAQRDALAASAQWRPMITGICAVLGCELPPWREPAAITMLDRGVHPHARRPGVLTVRSTFRNDARWAQPWPTLVLTLSDVDGGAAAQRAFEPGDYLPRSTAPGLLAPGQAASVTFDVLEPAPRTVAFAFEFR